MLGKLFVIDIFALILAAEAADGEVLVAAHLLNTALDGVAALVVYLTADQLNELFLLAVHILRQQQTAAGGGGEQNLPHERHSVTEQRRTAGQILRLREACVQADALDLADTAHNRLDRGAVKLVHAAGKLLHIAVLGRAAPEHKGNERIHGGGLALKLREQSDAHTGGLEFIGAQMTEKNTGHDFISGIFHEAPP